MHKRLTKSISHDLFLRMIGFGITIGVAFPFFTYFILDVPKDEVFNSLFFSFCVTAGIAVGLCNYYFFKVVVDLYFKGIQLKLTDFRQNLENLLGTENFIFESDYRTLNVCSADTIGDTTEDCNIVIKKLLSLLKAERKTTIFLNQLQQKNKTREVAETIVEVFKEYFGADGGCLYSLENGRLRQVSNSLLMIDSKALDQDYCYDIVKRGEIVFFREIDNLPVRFNIGIGSIKPNAIAYLPIIYQSRPVGLCILSAKNDFKNDFLSLESRNLINQAAPFLYNSLLIKKLEVMAAVDELTGLLNRRYGMKRLNEEFERAKRHHLPLAISMLDIDNFKLLNDTYGHQAGDLILKEFAATIEEEIRVSEFALRYGGEEFLLVIPGASTTNCHRVIERLRRKAENLKTTFQQHTVTFTFSAGIAAHPGEAINDQKQLINAADIALYQAKKKGKNRIVIYSSANHPAKLNSNSENP